MSYSSMVTKDGRTSQYTAAGWTETFSVHIDTGSVAAQTAFMIVDISDNTNWPHTETGHIHLEWIIVEADPDTAFLGEIKLGFLSAVDATNGDFNQFLDIDMAKQSNLIVETLDFGSHGIDLVPEYWFGPTIANSTLFQTDVNLYGPDAATSYPSGDGDLILLVERSAGTVSVSISIGYETIA